MCSPLKLAYTELPLNTIIKLHIKNIYNLLSGQSMENISFQNDKSIEAEYS